MDVFLGSAKVSVPLDVIQFSSSGSHTVVHGLWWYTRVYEVFKEEKKQ